MEGDAEGAAMEALSIEVISASRYDNPEDVVQMATMGGGPLARALSGVDPV